MLFLLSVTLGLAAIVAAGKNYDINVGKGAVLKFDPETLSNVAAGDTLTYHFFAKVVNDFLSRVSDLVAWLLKFCRITLLHSHRSMIRVIMSLMAFFLGSPHLHPMILRVLLHSQ